MAALEKQQLYAQADNHQRQTYLPHHVPGNNLAGGQKEQNAPAKAYARTHLVLVRKEAHKAGNNDKQRPPAFGGEIKSKDAGKAQYPKDSSGNQGQAEEPLLLKAFWDALPEEFEAKDFKAIAQEVGLSIPTAERYIRQWVDTWLDKVSRGQYRKR